MASEKQEWDKNQFKYTFVGWDKKKKAVEFRTYSLSGFYTGVHRATLGMDGIE